MAISNLQLYLVWREKFGEKDAQTIVEYIAEKCSEYKERQRQACIEEIEQYARKAAYRLKLWTTIAKVPLCLFFYW
jgi:hypothetical protein